jgi:hypothetical protein
MAYLLAVIALNSANGAGLLFLLLAALGDMANFIAVAALGQAARNDFASILQTLDILRNIFGPDLTVTRTRRVPLEPVRHGVFLLQVALKVHIGQSSGKARLLNSNEPELDVLGAKCFLKLHIGGLRICLEVGLDRILDIINVALLDSLLQQLPGFLWGESGERTSINKPSALAATSSMT